MTAATVEPRGSLVDALARSRQARSAVEELIGTPARLAPLFRPIGAVQDTSPTGPFLGWQSFPGRDVRAGGRSLPDLLLEATQLGLSERLDWALRCHTFDVAVAAGLEGELHLRPDPTTYGSPCPPRLAVPFLQGRRALAVVAELPAAAFHDPRRTRAAVTQMREWGWQFCYPDLSGQPEERVALDLLEFVRPAYVQLEVAGPRTSSLVAPARDLGASVLAVGVDSAAALDHAARAGARWAHGDLIGRGRSTPA
jgi:hypothetical protein